MAPSRVHASVWSHEKCGLRAIGFHPDLIVLSAKSVGSHATSQTQRSQIRASSNVADHPCLVLKGHTARNPPIRHKNHTVPTKRRLAIGLSEKRGRNALPPNVRLKAQRQHTAQPQTSPWLVQRPATGGAMSWWGCRVLREAQQTQRDFSSVSLNNGKSLEG